MRFLQCNLRHEFVIKIYGVVIVGDPCVVCIDSLHLRKPCGLKTVVCNYMEEYKYLGIYFTASFCLLRSSVFNGRPCTDSVGNSFYSFFSSRRFLKLKYLACLLSYKVQICRAYW